MYENLQEERLDILQEDLVSCIEGEEGNGGTFVELLELRKLIPSHLNTSFLKVMTKTWMTRLSNNSGKRIKTLETKFTNSKQTLLMEMMVSLKSFRNSWLINAQCLLKLSMLIGICFLTNWKRILGQVLTR